MDKRILSWMPNDFDMTGADSIEESVQFNSVQDVSDTLVNELINEYDLPVEEATQMVEEEVSRTLGQLKAKKKAIKLRKREEALALGITVQKLDKIKSKKAKKYRRRNKAKIEKARKIREKSQKGRRAAKLAEQRNKAFYNKQKNVATQ
jgi:hypothetical protein